MVTNCKNCGLPIFHGAAGYAGAQCRCGFSAKPNYDHNALTELLKERDQLKADSEVVTGLAESRLAENLRLKAENEQQAARIAELQLDADRYRWLEANSTYGIDYRQRPELTLPIYAPDHRDGLDAAIDAAMGSKGE